MTVEELLSIDCRPDLTAVAAPEADPFQHPGALNEADLLGVRFDPGAAELGVLFDLGGAMQIRNGDTALLVIRHCRTFAWSVDPPWESQETTQERTSERTNDLRKWACG